MITTTITLCVLFMLVGALSAGWIMFMVGQKLADKDGDRRVEDLRTQYEDALHDCYIKDEANARILQQVLRGGELLGHEFSVEHGADWAFGADRMTSTFNNVLEFLQCIDTCRQTGRTVFYTRVGSLVVSN